MSEVMGLSGMKKDTKGKRLAVQYVGWFCLALLIGAVALPDALASAARGKPAALLTSTPESLDREIDQKLDVLRAKLRGKGHRFSVGRTPALDFSIGQIAGLKEPKDWRITAKFKKPKSVMALPSSFDWRDQGVETSVKNQGACGSCWAFATVAPLEHNIKRLLGVERDLSEQYLLSCNTDGWDCGGGWWAHDYHVSKMPPGETEAGSVIEANFPYRAQAVSCGGPYSHYCKIDGWYFVGGGLSIPPVDAIKQAITDHGPVAVAICVGDMFQAYTGGVFDYSEEDSCGGGINHAVTLVGWYDEGPGSGYWILKNSWGAGWGEGGYMRIAYGTSNVGYSANYVEFSGNCSQLCSYSVTPEAELFGPASGKGTFFVQADDGCAWAASPSASWMSIASGSPGAGAGMVTFTVSQNTDMAERSGSVTVSGARHAVTQSGTHANSLTNPGFEEGHVGWVEQSIYALAWQDAGIAYSGQWLTWLGGYNNGNDVLFQDVAAPTAGAGGLYAQFWYYFETDETSGQIADTLVAEIRRPGDNAVLKTLVTLSNLDATGGWMKTAPIDVSEFAGQAIRFYFKALTNAKLTTNFFLDEIQLLSPAPTTPLNSYPDFAIQQYRDFLNRDPDPAGLAYWTNLLATGQMTRAEVVESFLWSAEFGGLISPLVRLYFAYFLRVPDYWGLLYWIGNRQAGMPLAEVSENFSLSQEFTETYGSLTDDAFIELIYTNVLGRGSDPDGKAYWLAKIASGMTRGEVMLGFSDSAEYQTIMANEVLAVMMYVGLLRRSPEPLGFLYWLAYLDQGNPPLAMINGFLIAPEYRGRF